MVETILELKNNKKRKTLQMSTQIMSLKKILGSITSKRVAHGIEPLRVSLDDIENIETKGKWWLIGSAWKGHDSEDLKIGVKDNSGELLELARAHKMNTDVRRNIFVTVMSSEDFIDAFEKLLKLNLKDKQQRDIIRVLFHCIQQVLFTLF